MPNVKTITLTGEETAVTFPCGYPYYSVLNMSGGELYVSGDPNIVPYSDGVYTVLSGMETRISPARSRDTLYLLGNGLVQIRAEVIAVPTSFKALPKGGEADGVSVKFLKVDALPDDGNENIIYLMQKDNILSGNVYDEYIYIDGNYEHLGTSEINLDGYTTTKEFERHIEDKNNPHGVTKLSVGLGNADNTADSEKRVAAADILTTARTINNTQFDGSSDIRIKNAYNFNADAVYNIGRFVTLCKLPKGQTLNYQGLSFILSGGCAFGALFRGIYLIELSNRNNKFSSSIVSLISHSETSSPAEFYMYSDDMYYCFGVYASTYQSGLYMTILGDPNIRQGNNLNIEYGILETMHVVPDNAVELPITQYAVKSEVDKINDKLDLITPEMLEKLKNL